MIYDVEFWFTVLDALIVLALLGGLVYSVRIIRKMHGKDVKAVTGAVLITYASFLLYVVIEFVGRYGGNHFIEHEVANTFFLLVVVAAIAGSIEMNKFARVYGLKKGPAELETFFGGKNGT